MQRKRNVLNCIYENPSLVKRQTIGSIHFLIEKRMYTGKNIKGHVNKEPF